MIQEQENRSHRSSVRQIKFSDTVYTNRTLLAFSNTIQHPIIDVTVLVDVNHPVGNVVVDSLSELNNHKFEDISNIQFIPLLQKPLSSCHDFPCEKYRAILCGFYGSPNRNDQLGFQLCVLKEYEGDLIAKLRRCALQHHIFYPTIGACLSSPEPESLVLNMTRYAIEAIRTMDDKSMEMKLASIIDDDELNEENSYDNTLSIEVSTDAVPVTLKEQVLISSLLPLTLLVNHRVVLLDSPLSQHVCDAIQNSAPLVCSKVQPVTEKDPKLNLPEIDVYLHVGCKNNLQSLDGLFEWMITYPE